MGRFPETKVAPSPADGARSESAPSPHGNPKGIYASTKDALKSRFDPESCQKRFQVEFQTRRKKASEGWADLADDLKSLADKAYPTLQEEACERLSINAYLNQLTPQLAFSVRQKRPDSLDSAVATTLEMESYLVPPGQVACGVQPKGETVCPVSTTSDVRRQA